MSDLKTELHPYLLKGNIDYCIKRANEEITKIPQSPFHIIKDLEFSNDHEEIAKFFDNFIIEQSKKYQIKALYTETNEFSLNTDRWYFGLCAYKQYGGHEDYGWLGDWTFEHPSVIILTGMEDLQKIYGKYNEEKFGFYDDDSDLFYNQGDYVNSEYEEEFEEDEFENSNYDDFIMVVDLLVTLKFQNLIKTIAPLIKHLNCPIFATSHDSNFIYEFKSKSSLN